MKQFDMNRIDPFSVNFRFGRDSQLEEWLFRGMRDT